MHLLFISLNYDLFADTYSRFLKEKGARRVYNIISLDLTKNDIKKLIACFEWVFFAILVMIN